MTQTRLASGPALASRMRTLVRYGVVGGSSALVYYGLFLAGLRWLSPPLHYLAVILLAHAMSMAFAFPLQRRFVFASRRRAVPDFLRFATVYASGLVASLVGVPLLHGVASLPVELAQALVIVTVPIASFLLHNFWTFRRGPASEETGR